MKRLIEIRYTLIDMAEAESKKLYRLAWRAEEHGCSNRLVDEIFFRSCRDGKSDNRLVGILGIGIE